MAGKLVGCVAIIILFVVLVQAGVPAGLAGAMSTGGRGLIGGQMAQIIPLSIEMVDRATAVLSKGLSDMNLDEKAALARLYDPSGSGDVDQAFVDEVLDNYGRIRRTLDEGLSGRITVVYEPDSDVCRGKRLYYIDLRLHVCPYFNEERDEARKARTLIHEMAHRALLVTDRTYYRPTNKAYAELTPRGPWTAQLPLVGPLFRELARSDTLYHPDAYAHFALMVTAQAGEVEVPGGYPIGCTP
jgi:hypothetical protein